VTPGLPPGIGPGRPSRLHPGRVVLALITMLAWAPLLSVLFTAEVADALSCRVDEGSVHPCPGPFGTDLGELLYTTGMMGWFLLITGPFMLGTAILWIVILLRCLVRRIRR
jgi:hypothetical protein